MMNLLTYKFEGLEYYELNVITQQQLEAAVKLSEMNGLYPLTARDIQEFKAHNFFGIPEAYLLCRNESTLGYGSPTYPHNRLVRFKISKQRYEGFLLFFVDNQNVNEVEINVRTFCRDPWSDVRMLTAWLNNRLMIEAAKYSGAVDIRVYAAETDTAFQLELRKHGYYCEQFEPDFSLIKDSLRGHARGNLIYSKLLGIRSRQDLGIFSERTKRKK